MIQFLKRYATGRNALILFALYAAMLVFVMMPSEKYIKLHASGTGPIDLVQFYTPQQAYDMIGRYDPDALRFYKSFVFTGDLVYPILYTLFFGVTILFLFKKAFPVGHFLQKLTFIPFVPICFDMLENILLLFMLNKYPTYPDWMGQMAAVASGSKWAVFFVVIALLLVGLTGWVAKVVRGG